MHLSEIQIYNYKSISDITIPVKKYGDSYTSVLVGLNEAGKSNILEAISLISKNCHKNSYKYSDLKNRNLNKKYVDLFYQYEFDNDKEWKLKLKKKIDISPEFEKKIKLTSCEKNVYLSNESSSFSNLSSIYWDKSELDLSQFSYKKENNNTEKLYTIKENSEVKEEEKNDFTVLDEEKLSKILYDANIFDDKLKEPLVTIWKPEDKYLITKEVDLNLFAENINLSIPLRNIFMLCGYETQEDIKNKISTMSRPESKNLEKQLSRAATNYINNVWKEHKISIEVDIEHTNKILSVFISDKDNEDEYFNMSERSQGFKQFISLILNLSISNNKNRCRDSIIIIDEPENHLHPSGIRYMRDELIKIGNNNYVFVATHSPFLIDNKNMNRHFLVKKNQGNTQIKQINKETMLADEEVLRMGFGINIMKDLLTPYKILVEGMSDLNILRKVLNKVAKDLCIGMTNGQGGNIVQIASLLKYSEVDCFVIVDDDKEGKDYKEKITKLGEPFSINNVLTIRDLCGDIIPGGTIEDILNKEFVISNANKIIKEENPDLNIVEADIDGNKPILENIKVFLHKNDLKDMSNDIIFRIKNNLGEKFNISGFETKHPLLKTLAENIVAKIKD